MKLSVAYEVKDDYLLVKAMGEFDSSTAQNVFLDWVTKARNHALNRILCDITLVSGIDAGEPSIMSRFEISKFVAQSLPGEIKLAVLETPGQHLRDNFAENVMANRGANVIVTSNRNEALEWIGVIYSNK
jgi:hypothetical protein